MDQSTENTVPFYYVIDWEKNFECAQSRKVLKELGWIPVKTKHDGLSFSKIMSEGKRGLEIYACWHLIIQVAAKCPKRGQLIKNGVPLTAKDIALMTGASEKSLSMAMEYLSSPAISWLGACYHYATTAVNSDGPTLHNNTVQDSTALPLQDDSTPKEQEQTSVQVFLDLLDEKYLTPITWSMIETNVPNDPASLDLWRRVVTAWVSIGYSPRNVQGMVEYFQRKEIPSKGKLPGQDLPQKGWVDPKHLEAAYKIAMEKKKADEEAALRLQAKRAKARENMERQREAAKNAGCNTTE